MPRQSLAAVTSAIDSLLAGAVDPQSMPAAIEQVRQLFDGSKACLGHVGAVPEDHAAFATHVDEALQQRCFGDLADDFMSMAGTVRSRVRPGQVYRDTEVLGVQEFRSSRLWREWMQPQDMYGGLACRFAEAGPSFYFFDVQRGRMQEAFDGADAELLQRMQPVLNRVAEIHRHVGRLQLQLDLARGALDTIAVGMVVVDADMTIVYANEEADEILSCPDSALALRQGRLFARQPAEQRGLRGLIDAALRSAADALEPVRSSMILRGQDGSQAISACVMPARRSASLGQPQRQVMIALRTLRAAADPACSLRQLFDLTDTEARFACALAAGMSLADAADAQRVRISTARTHLARIFQKTQTRQQSQLVSLLRSAMLPLRVR